MTQPRLELLPLTPGLQADRPGELTVLARISVDAPAAERRPRPALNLALVLDRSGSMSGEPLRMAGLAARAAIGQLGAQDRVAVLAFDDEVQTILPSQPVRDRDGLTAQIAEIPAGGSTALQAGWLAGAAEVASHLESLTSLNRVILLSDGQANVGESRPQVLAQQAAELKARGISTTAIGLGSHYAEDLMRALADAGDGNFEHIEDPAALPGFFELELSGLTRTVGHTVSLGIEPNPEVRVLKVQGLNDLLHNEFGRSQLPNLLAGRTTDFLFTLQLPPQREVASLGITRVRLAWTDSEGRRQRIRAQLDLPVLSAAAYGQVTENAEVRAALELLLNAKAKQDAVAFLDAGDIAGAQQILRSRSAQFSELQDALAFCVPQAQLDVEVSQLENLAATAERDQQLSRKRALSQHYQRSRSKAE